MKLCKHNYDKEFVEFHKQYLEFHKQYLEKVYRYGAFGTETKDTYEELKQKAIKENKWDILKEYVKEQRHYKGHNGFMNMKDFDIGMASAYGDIISKMEALDCGIRKENKE